MALRAETVLLGALLWEILDLEVSDFETAVGYTLSHRGSFRNLSEGLVTESSLRSWT